MLYTLLRTTGLAALLSPMQVVGAFLAAPAHDLDHRGFSNLYEKNEKTDVGVKYDPPLETHHAALAQASLEKTVRRPPAIPRPRFLFWCRGGHKRHGVGLSSWHIVSRAA